VFPNFVIIPSCRSTPLIWTGGPASCVSVGGGGGGGGATHAAKTTSAAIAPSAILGRVLTTGTPAVRGGSDARRESTRDQRCRDPRGRSTLGRRHGPVRDARRRPAPRGDTAFSFAAELERLVQGVVIQCRHPGDFANGLRLTERCVPSFPYRSGDNTRTRSYRAALRRPFRRSTALGPRMGQFANRCAAHHFGRQLAPPASSPPREPHGGRGVTQ
jgi:hypothetical protein